MSLTHFFFKHHHSCNQQHRSRHNADLHTTIEVTHPPQPQMNQHAAKMISLLFGSAIMTATVALAACTGTPQCNTNADCNSGYICGPSDVGTSTCNVCVKTGTCNNKPDPQFPKNGPKCGDSIFCNVGGFCGEGYFKMNGETILAEVCVNAATGAKCAQST